MGSLKRWEMAAGGVRCGRKKITPSIIFRGY
jgi:hypothetical protein